MIGIPTHPGVAAVTFAQLAGLLLPAVVAGWDHPTAFAMILAAASFTALAWENIFAAMRGLETSYHGLTTALIAAILVPHDIAMWQVVVAISLGCMLGELVFGGRGFGFASAPAVTLALMLISFPQVSLQASTEALAFATLPGTALLLALGLISWRVILSVLLSVAAMLALRGHGVDPTTVAVALVFSLTFLICDPAASSATKAGQWAYGALCGAFAVTFSSAGTIASEALVFATLLGGIFAPLIDHLVVLAHTAGRRRRHG